MPKQWRIAITVDKELYELLENRANKEARTLASLGKYLLLKGLEAEKIEASNKWGATGVSKVVYKLKWINQRNLYK